jgi:hypothetical protein
MKKITINVVFNVSGHGNIGVIPTHFGQWTINTSSSRDFNLDPGDYSVTYLIATANGGSITVTGGDTELGEAILTPGVAGGNLDITVI